MRPGHCLCADVADESRSQCQRDVANDLITRVTHPWPPPLSSQALVLSSNDDTAASRALDLPGTPVDSGRKIRTINAAGEHGPHQQTSVNKLLVARHG